MIPFLVFAVLLLHGGLLGLTDDEAYYWVLAQHPAAGYAFHPPGVAWMIAASQFLFGWIFGANSPVVVRLPAAASSAALVGLGLSWMRAAGAPAERLGRGALAMLSFAGLFAASWMIVPDLPLLLGWALAFHATWALCGGRAAWDVYARLAAGVALALLAKYSGVLVAGSAGLALLLWAPRGVRLRGVVVVIAGALIAAVPIITWNAAHEWGSILYQVQERQRGQVSWVRYARFWGSQALFAGPALLVYAFLLVRRVRAKDVVASQVSRYVAVWALPPALAYCVQPLWADFKPHWAFIVWLPIAMELGWAWSRGANARLARVQCAYGLTFAVLGLAVCHIPLTPWVTALATGREPDPRWDVTNDMYGWRELREALRETKLPVIGARYQTASQAAFALGDLSRATLIPRDLKQRDEWPDLGVSGGQGPEWPKLNAEVVFISDNRYDAAPGFPGAKCVPFRDFEKKRGSYVAKRIRLWRCLP